MQGSANWAKQKGLRQDHPGQDPYPIATPNRDAKTDSRQRSLLCFLGRAGLVAHLCSPRCRISNSLLSIYLSLIYFTDDTLPAHRLQILASAAFMGPTGHPTRPVYGTIPVTVPNKASPFPEGNATDVFSSFLTAQTTIGRAVHLTDVPSLGLMPTTVSAQAAETRLASASDGQSAGQDRYVLVSRGITPANVAEG